MHGLFWRGQAEPRLSEPFSLGSAMEWSNPAMHRRLLVTLLLLAPLPAASVRAHEHTDSERARAALETGQIRPLSELLSHVESRYVGRVIETELEQEHRRWIYEFKFLPPAGHIFTVKVDAATGEVIGTRGPVQEQR